MGGIGPAPMGHGERFMPSPPGILAEPDGCGIRDRGWRKAR